MPKAKPDTRWESFAKTRGIQNKKKSRMEWDEKSQEYRPRFGYKRGKDEHSDWLIEVPQSAGDLFFLSFFLSNNNLGSMVMVQMTSRSHGGPV
jgi:hypothetical protein